MCGGCDKKYVKVFTPSGDIDDGCWFCAIRGSFLTKKQDQAARKIMRFLRRCRHRWHTQRFSCRTFDVLDQRFSLKLPVVSLQDQGAEADEGAGEERTDHLNHVFISSPGGETQRRGGEADDRETERNRDVWSSSFSRFTHKTDVKILTEKSRVTEREALHHANFILFLSSVCPSVWLSLRLSVSPPVCLSISCLSLCLSSLLLECVRLSAALKGFITSVTLPSAQSYRRFLPRSLLLHCYLSKSSTSFWSHQEKFQLFTWWHESTCGRWNTSRWAHSRWCFGTSWFRLDWWRGRGLRKARPISSRRLSSGSVCVCSLLPIIHRSERTGWCVWGSAEEKEIRRLCHV